MGSHGYGRYVGRVGTLAVALGIGVGLGYAPPTAWADDSASSSSAKADSSTGHSARTARSGDAGPARRARGHAAAGVVPPRLRSSQTNSAATTPRGSASTTTPTATADPGTPSAASLIFGPDLNDTGHTGKPTPTTPTPGNPLADLLQPLKVCACKLVMKVIESIGNVVGGEGSGGGPALPPINNPILAAVAEFARRSVNQILALPPVAHAVQIVNEQMKLALDRFTFAAQDLIRCANPVQTQPLPADLDRTSIVSGLDQPTDFRFLPDGHILILQRDGSLLIAPNTEGATAVKIATIPPSDAFELDPNFATNGYFYTTYNSTDSHAKLSRFTMVNDTVDPKSEVVLIDSIQSGSMHQGNTMLFGPDGKIYFAMGDDSLNTNGQNLSNIFGKILRINPDGSIPQDNPFYNTPGARQEIYALGMRNPFRMTFTPTGQLLVGDVGDESWEEINNVVAGGNYGWPVQEGPCASCQYDNPVYAYPHTPPPGRAGSITSVMVYTGTALPAEYQGKVFVADYTLHWLKVLTFDSTYTNVVNEQLLDTDAGTTVQMQQGPDGNLYQLNIYPGELYRIAASGGNRAPTAVLTATPTSGYSPLAVQFSSAGSSDPDPGTTLTYSWDFGDGGTSVAANPVRTYNTNGSYTVTLTVSDGERTNTASQKIVVGSTPPDVKILTPLNDSHYNAGDVISFSATATDAEDGTLPDSAYNWRVIFHHADHIHPYVDSIVGPSGTVSLATNEHNVATTWYEISLTVTDSSGLSTTKSVNIKPNLVTLTFGSNDPNAVYTVDGIPHTGTFSQQAVVGVVRHLDAGSPQTVPDGQLVFNHWSDGLAQQHVISTPGSDTAYTVYFDKTPSSL
ncbi:PQQ-dependent sugar dehydrogenase [Mycobacterium crocinum]|uniref:PQQ-dependent sugar dehydrogenase n=1 Tax=Mycolicibacterium crocinum TaxID=388459 RepID=A0ABY3TI71_9MYCO|nr:PQQ-dependent sugar dehydrogenase [Mycolicibacterium crocinum]MCV7216121.1 PQQ-dependent sugar dehydrogenase [Mycolicibacterium crocinum]ULN41056.1 PQQ-dependent sugar dehydrogenase [Mycolicibacterium crocinum]